LVQHITYLIKKGWQDLENLVTHDRLKLCNLDRKKFSECLPRFATGEEVAPRRVRDQVEAKSLEVVVDKRVNGKTHYLVKFDDNMNYWCDWISPMLRRGYEKVRNRKPRSRPRSK